MTGVRSRFDGLNNKRSGLVSRCERFAELTVRSVCPKDGYDEGSDNMPHDIQSVGAMATNNLVNKMMLAMFAPSRPFMRFDMPNVQRQQMLDAFDISEDELREMLSSLEMDCIRYLDGTASRPKLYDLMTHLVVTGNGLRYMDGDVMRILPLKQYVSRRNAKGEVVELILRESVLRVDVHKDLHGYFKGTNDDTPKTFYRWFQFDGELFQESQWLDDVKIEEKGYSGQYKREDMPATHHVWRLPDGSNYGIGHVEDNSGDLEGLSELSQAELNGAILASEFRWLANPGGMTRPEDVETSRNGDVIPGLEGDLSLVSAGAIANSIAVVSASADKWIRRLSAAFLVTGGVQRDAERVTAEEIRLLASELETGLGGIYSRLAVDLQLPLAYWLMGKVADKEFQQSDFKPYIVTGLDALSRNGDLENLRLFVQDVIQITSLPPEVSGTLRLDNIFSGLAAGRGLKASQYVKSQEETQQETALNTAQEQDRALEQIEAKRA